MGVKISAHTSLLNFFLGKGKTLRKNFGQQTKSYFFGSTDMKGTFLKSLCFEDDDDAVIFTTSNFLQCKTIIASIQKNCILYF